MGPLSAVLLSASLLIGAGTSASQPLGWSGDPGRPGAPQVQHLSPQVRDVASAVESLVAERAQETQVVLGTDVLFAFDSADLPAEAQRQLAGVVAEIEERRPTSVLVEGHTDGLGGDDYNQDLSERRAAAVANVLADLAGAGPSFEQTGYGSTQPLVPEVRHGGGQVRVRAGRHGDQVVVALHDTGPGTPTARSVPVDAQGGRGLALVDVLASSWGVTVHPAADADRPAPPGGKTVWFDLAVGT